MSQTFYIGIVDVALTTSIKTQLGGPISAGDHNLRGINFKRQCIPIVEDYK